MAGQGGQGGTHSLQAPFLVLELRADRPSLGDGKERAQEGQGLTGASLTARGLLTSVCLLLAFLESFRPVLFRSLQDRGQRLEARVGPHQGGM